MPKKGKTRPPSGKWLSHGLPDYVHCGRSGYRRAWWQAQYCRYRDLSRRSAMFANSRTVTSNQTGQHQDLALTVREHLDHPWQAPVSS